MGGGGYGPSGELSVFRPHKVVSEAVLDHLSSFRIQHTDQSVAIVHVCCRINLKGGGTGGGEEKYPLCPP